MRNSSMSRTLDLFGQKHNGTLLKPTNFGGAVDLGPTFVCMAHLFFSFTIEFDGCKENARLFEQEVVALTSICSNCAC